MFNIFKKRSDYKIINYSNLEELKKIYDDVWKDERFPEKQWNRVEKQLKNVDEIPEFRAIIECIKATELKNPSILDVGCSSGYLSEVLKIKKIRAKYEGTDYSPSFINFARNKYPKETFSVNDATNLKYKDKNFDIVVSACCLLHIINYKKAISEAARVAKKYVIFHRTPVYSIRPTTFFTKTAYNAEMLEIIFNEDELVDIFKKNNLSVVKIKTISSEENTTIKNYLCLKGK
mgnify:CR=1 FL=1